MMKKKGFQISEVPMLAVTFGVIALILGVMATVLTQMQTTESSSAKVEYEYDSNTVTLTNVTPVFFGSVDVKGNQPLSCTSVVAFNGSDARVTTGNVTLSGAGGCYAVVLGAYNNSAIQMNYTLGVSAYSTSYNITGEGIQAQVTLSGWQQTWIVIVASAVVLGIISAYLFFKKE